MERMLRMRILEEKWKLRRKEHEALESRSINGYTGDSSKWWMVAKHNIVIYLLPNLHGNFNIFKKSSLVTRKTGPLGFPEILKKSRKEFKFLRILAACFRRY